MIAENRCPKLLILTLYSGENEFSQCMEALERQYYTNWKHELFSNMPNTEAHQALYSRIMRSREGFDLFLKIDADMVLTNANTLSQIVNSFKQNPGMDHAVFAVNDWYSQTDIMGLHVYTNRVRWAVNDEKLFVDPNPEIEGYKKLFWNEPAPVADHSPDPSLEEAFLFGLHRALKVIQRDRWKKNIDHACFHFNLLKTVWQRFLESNDLRRGAVLWGAEYAFSEKDQVIENKSDRLIHKENMDLICDMGVEGIQKALMTQWSPERTRLYVREWQRIKLPKMTNLLIRLTGRVKSIFKGLKN